MARWVAITVFTLGVIALLCVLYIAMSQPFVLSFVAGLLALLIADHTPPLVRPAAGKLARLFLTISLIVSVESIGVFILSSYSNSLIGYQIVDGIDSLHTHINELFQNIVWWLLLVGGASAALILARPAILRTTMRLADILESAALVMFGVCLFSLGSAPNVLAFSASITEAGKGQFLAAYQLKFAENKRLVYYSATQALLNEPRFRQNRDLSDVLSMGQRYLRGCYWYPDPRYPFNEAHYTHICGPLYFIYFQALKNIDPAFGEPDRGDGGDSDGTFRRRSDIPPDPPALLPELKKETAALDEAARKLHARCETLNILLVELFAKTTEFAGLDDFGKASLAEFSKALMKPYIARIMEKLMHSAESQHLKGSGGFREASNAIRRSLEQALLVAPQSGASSPPIIPGSPSSGSSTPTTARSPLTPVIVPKTMPSAIP